MRQLLIIKSVSLILLVTILACGSKTSKPENNRFEVTTSGTYQEHRYYYNTIEEASKKFESSDATVRAIYDHKLDRRVRYINKFDNK